MFALLLSTLFSAAFAMVMRFAQGKDCDLVAVGAVNYLVASGFQWIFGAAAGGAAPPWRPETVLIGVAAGILYATAYFLMFPLMRLRGVSISAAVMRLSVVIPVGVAILQWGERMSALQAAGSILALASFPLLGIVPSSRGGDPKDRKRERRTFLILAGLFVNNGLVLLAPRLYKQTGIRGEESAYLGILFGTAAVVLVTAWAVQALRRRTPVPIRAEASGEAPVPIRAEASGEAPVRIRASASPLMTIGCGVALGLSNALCNRGTVFALQSLPSIIVFPFYSAVGLAVTVLVSRFAWNERFRPAEAAGLAAACAAALLVNAG